MTVAIAPCSKGRENTGNTHLPIKIEGKKKSKGIRTPIYGSGRTKRIRSGNTVQKHGIHPNGISRSIICLFCKKERYHERTREVETPKKQNNARKTHFALQYSLPLGCLLIQTEKRK